MALPPTPPLDLAPLYDVALAAAAQALPCLAAAAVFATLRIALQRSHPSRTASEAPPGPSRERLAPLLAQAERLATSAGVFEVLARIAFSVLLVRAFARGESVTWEVVLASLVVAWPALLVAGDALPTALATRGGDRILVAALPTFHAVQLPLRWLVAAFELVRVALRRVFGLGEADPAARRIVEELREVIEDAEPSRDLEPNEREIIENVIEFRDSNVSDVMTPRTEISGVEVHESAAAAARVAATCGHSRIPVYDQSLDTIVGIVTARDLVRAAADGAFDRATLRSLARPAYFVPETKRVADMLADFRREKIKIAIVLDEYGGTAGVVTLGDILDELVGDVDEGHPKEQRESVRRLPDGSSEVDASMHVSEVNEELGFALEESQEYDTLAGLVLATLGRFPKRGEKFEKDGVELQVIEASDRRVIKVSLRRAAVGSIASDGR